MSTPAWDRAGALPVPYEGSVRPEVLALPPGMPDVAALFTFMRDAELRFDTLRARIEERTQTTRGEHLVVNEVLVRHPGHARVTTSEPHRGTAGNYEVWISDGETVRTYSAPHKLGTQRPVRRSVVGLDDPDLPGRSQVYRPITALPMETLPEAFVHPAGYCQNVLATGRCWISGTDLVAGREAIVVDCDHPRSVEVVADRPDFHVQVAADRATGVITRLRESVAGVVSRHAEVVLLEIDGPLVSSAFEFKFPAGTTLLY